MIIENTKTIGEIVANDYRTAGIFSKLGIDFCCKGNRTVKQVCEKQNINEDELIDELQTLEKSSSESIDYTSWPLDLLVDYIEKKHHRYVEEKIPVLMAFLEKLTKVHGKNHPELFEIYDLFRASAGDLTKHLKKEELILFPFIKKMTEAKLINNELDEPFFGTVENPISMMKHEHETEGDRFAKISELSNSYTPPADACNTYKVTFSMLKEFEEDLHKHIHLENNILFPKAIKMQENFN